MLVLVELEKPHWGHIGYQFGLNDRHGLYEETDVCNGCKCYKWKNYG